MPRDLITPQEQHPDTARTVLVVGHPGHELRVYGWMMTSHPVVHVLTDGSGSDRQPRIASTTTLLDTVGATAGSIYGRMSDREIYGAILDGDHARFIVLAEELAATLISNNVSVVAGDAVEGFNPSHDVCRYVINAAVRLAAASGQAIACYAFPLDGPPDAGGNARRGALRVDLTDEMLTQKLEAAYAYAELRGEVESALQRVGSAPFRTEWLFPVDLDDPYGRNPDETPYYEVYGAQRVSAGAYAHLVTFREHVRPLAEALWCHRAVSA